jgi:hypothetical protein
MGRCTGGPEDSVPEPPVNSKPTLNTTQEYEQLSDVDPPDPPLPPGHYRKKHSKLKNAYYFVDTTTLPGRSGWSDPRRQGGRIQVPPSFAAIWNTISQGQAIDIGNAMAQIKQIPGCTDAGVLRNVTNKLNAYTELQGRIAALGDNVEPAARAANLQLLKFAAMAVGHEVAAGNRNTEQGTKWSPYRCKPKKHKGATGTAKVTKANSRQSGADVEVVFYAFSPVSSGDSSLMIYSNQFGDLEAPRVRMSPVHGLSPNSPIVSGSVRIPANSIKPEWTYCLALAQGDVWIREKGTQDCIIALRRFEAAGNRPRVNVWCSSPYPMFPFSELDHELASQGETK